MAIRRRSCALGSQSRSAGRPLALPQQQLRFELRHRGAGDIFLEVENTDKAAIEAPAPDHLPGCAQVTQPGNGAYLLAAPLDASVEQEVESELIAKRRSSRARGVG